MADLDKTIFMFMNFMKIVVKNYMRSRISTFHRTTIVKFSTNRIKVMAAIFSIYSCEFLFVLDFALGKKLDNHCKDFLVAIHPNLDSEKLGPCF